MWRTLCQRISTHSLRSPWLLHTPPLHCSDALHRSDYLNGPECLQLCAQNFDGVLWANCRIQGVVSTGVCAFCTWLAIVQKAVKKVFFPITIVTRRLESQFWSEFMNVSQYIAHDTSPPWRWEAHSPNGGHHTPLDGQCDNKNCLSIHIAWLHGDSEVCADLEFFFEMQEAVCDFIHEAAGQGRYELYEARQHRYSMVIAKTPGRSELNSSF